MTSKERPSDVPVRRMKFTDSNELPHDYSTTPGGSIFSTTPGGTRIYYDRETVLLCKNSPIARSPPSGLICRPGVTCPLTCQGECNLPRMSANEQKPIATSDQHANQSTHKEGEPFELDL